MKEKNFYLTITIVEYKCKATGKVIRYLEGDKSIDIDMTEQDKKDIKQKLKNLIKEI